MAGLMEITLWLPIHADIHRSTLWWTKRRTGALPDGRDGIVLFMNEDPGDDPHEGPMLEPRRRYMDAEGNWHVELQKIILQPEREEWDRLRHAPPAPACSACRQSSFYFKGMECLDWIRWRSREEVDKNLILMAEQGWRIWRVG